MFRYFKPGAMGRANIYRKRLSHMSVIVRTCNIVRNSVGQKVNPIGFRLGVYRDWDSRWFARKSYGKELLEDFQIRRFLNTALENAEISKIEIEKAGDNIRVIIHSGRPGLLLVKKVKKLNPYVMRLLDA